MDLSCSWMTPDLIPFMSVLLFQICIRAIDHTLAKSVLLNYYLIKKRKVEPSFVARSTTLMAFRSWKFLKQVKAKLCTRYYISWKYLACAASFPSVGSPVCGASVLCGVRVLYTREPRMQQTCREINQPAFGIRKKFCFMHRDAQTDITRLLPERKTEWSKLIIILPLSDR